MTKPDWSKAPDWATHAVTTGPKWSGGAHLAGAVEWARFDGEHYFAGESDEVGHVFGESAWIVLESRPTQWRGPEDGLPPVGTVCEIAASTPYLKIDQPEGAQVKVYAHFTDDRGVKLAAYADSIGSIGGIATAKVFRPIKTQEQRELEQLQADITAWNNTAHKTGLSLADFLYDKGYRKP